jgi:hypothetical protein
MKSNLTLGTALFLATLLAGCGQSSNDGYASLQQTIADQNKSLLQQQQLMMSQQQQRIADEDARIDGLMQELLLDEADIKKLEAELATAQPVGTASVDTASSGVDTVKNKMVKSLAGFNARLSASIGYESYADSLGDLNADLTQSMLQIKDQNFVDEVNKILQIYNLAGDFWEKFVRDNVEDLVLSPTDRYRYSTIGVNFADNYHARPSDVRKFWTNASNEIDTMMQLNKEDLGIAVTITKK